MAGWRQMQIGSAFSASESQLQRQVEGEKETGNRMSRVEETKGCKMPWQQSGVVGFSRQACRRFDGGPIGYSGDLRW